MDTVREALKCFDVECCLTDEPKVVVNYAANTLSSFVDFKHDRPVDMKQLRQFGLNRTNVSSKGKTGKESERGEERVKKRSKGVIMRWKVTTRAGVQFY